MTVPVVTQEQLDNCNVAQGRKENRIYLDSLGGVNELITMIGVNIETGLTFLEIKNNRIQYGSNSMPKSPSTNYFYLLFVALSDTTLLILIAAACVSFAVGYWEDPKIGWIEGAAIFVAVFLVSNISAFNDYSKELQFRALEKSSQQDEKTSVFREGRAELIGPDELVVGDIIILQGGDMIPADSIVIDNNEVMSSESSLTGEPEDLRKSKLKDCFLLSSCLITEGEGCRAMVIGIGMNSQWGKIKANLVTESVNTPLQVKLERMTTLIGYCGIVAAIATFCALFIRIWATDITKPPTQQDIGHGVINAFILCVTIVVVAIPEGLPLAVTISLAYSTKKMYDDKCFIRQLAACETMGNATTICSDKTGKCMDT
jgi:Ca2+-transporting ATPase